MTAKQGPNASAILRCTAAVPGGKLLTLFDSGGGAHQQRSEQLTAMDAASAPKSHWTEPTVVPEFVPGILALLASSLLLSCNSCVPSCSVRAPIRRPHCTRSEAHWAEWILKIESPCMLSYVKQLPHTVACNYHYTFLFELPVFAVVEACTPAHEHTATTTRHPLSMTLTP